MVAENEALRKQDVAERMERKGPQRKALEEKAAADRTARDEVFRKERTGLGYKEREEAAAAARVERGGQRAGQRGSEQGGQGFYGARREEEEEDMDVAGGMVSDNRSLLFTGDRDAGSYGGARARAKQSSFAASADVRDNHAGAAERMQARGGGTNKFDNFKGSSGRGGGGGGRGGGRGRGRGRGSSGPHGFDEKMRAMIEANIEESQATITGQKADKYEWDPGVLQTSMALEISDNYNAAEMNSAPYLPGVSKPRAPDKDDDQILEEHRLFLMKFGDFDSAEEFDEVKKQALLQSRMYKAMDARARVHRGQSPIHGDFIAEQKLLADEVIDIGVEHDLHAFAQKAVKMLDGNSGWSYAKKIKALSFLQLTADRLQAR